MNDIVQAFIDYHAKHGRKIKIIAVEQGKGFAVDDVILSGPLEVTYEVIEGDEPPPEQGIITYGAGEPVRIEPRKLRDPWEALIAEEDAREAQRNSETGFEPPDQLRKEEDRGSKPKPLPSLY